MIRGYRTSESADRDIDEILAWLVEQADTETALRFLIGTDTCFRKLAANPAMGQRCFFDYPTLKDLRRIPLPSPFGSYLVFYRLTGRHVEIVRVLHGARDVEAILSPEDTPQ